MDEEIEVVDDFKLYVSYSISVLNGRRNEEIEVVGDFKLYVSYSISILNGRRNRSC